MLRVATWTVIGMTAIGLGGCVGTPLSLLPSMQNLADAAEAVQATVPPDGPTGQPARLAGEEVPAPEGTGPAEALERGFQDLLQGMRRHVLPPHVLPWAADRRVAGQWIAESDWTLLRERTSIAMERAVDGDHRSWTNAETGLSGMVRPMRTYQRADGVTCRDFRLTLAGPADISSTNGMACRHADGTWSLLTTDMGTG